jgi:hypothetical protein
MPTIRRSSSGHRAPAALERALPGGMLRPTAVAIVPLLVLFLQLDNVYGHRPLAPGESAMVTAQFSRGAVLDMLAATWKDAAWWWKRRACAYPIGARSAGACGRGPFRQRAAAMRAGSAIAKAVQCGRGLRHPANRWTGRRRLRCPARPPRWMSWASGVDWPVWFGIVSLLTMLALRKRFGVAL